MTLGDNKKIMLGLIEEYSPTNQYLTDDEDIKNRLNLVYSPNYQFISQKKPIIKTKTIIINNTDDGTTISTLPMDLRQLVKVIGLDSNNRRISPEYDTIGKKIYIKNIEGTYILEYYAYPTEITSETKDDFYLEIDADAQALLPYLVANDILKVDPSANYTSFYNEYQSRVQSLDTRTILPSATVEGGII